MNQEQYPQNLPDQTTAEDEIDLLDLIGVLIKHKWLIIGMTGAAALFILVYSIISLKLPPEKSYLPNLFTPRSTVMINEGGSGGGLSSMLDSSGLGSLAALAGISSGSGSSNSALAVKLAKSNTMVDILASEFNLNEVYEITESKFPKSSLRTIIKGKLSLEPDGETGTMTIGYEDIDRELATRIVNRMVLLLENEFNRIDRDSNMSQKTLLEHKMKDVEAEISRLESEFLVFQNQYNLLDASVMAEEFSKKTLELRTEIITLDAQISAMTTRTGIENPIIAEKKREKRALEAALYTLEEEGDYGLPPMNSMADILIEYETLKRNIEIQATIYKGVLEQYELTKLTDRGTGPTFQVLEEAEVPEMKSGPSRAKLCVIVTMAAFFLSLFAAFLREFWQNLKKDPERMKKLRGEV